MFGALGELSKRTSSDIDGLTAQRAGLREQEEALLASESRGAGWGSMLLPFLGGLAAGGFSKEGLGLGLSAAGAAGETYFNNLEADEKLRAALLNREVNQVDSLTDKFISRQNALDTAGLNMLSGFYQGSYPGTAPWRQIQNAEMDLFKTKENYTRDLQRERDILTGTQKYLTPEQYQRYYGALPGGGVPPADALTALEAGGGSRFLTIPSAGSPGAPVSPTMINPATAIGAKTQMLTGPGQQMVGKVLESAGVTPGQDPMSVTEGNLIVSAQQQLGQNVERERRQKQFNVNLASTQMFEAPSVPGFVGTKMGEQEKGAYQGASSVIASLERMKELMASGADQGTLREQANLIAEQAITFRGQRNLARTGANLTGNEKPLVDAMTPAYLGGPAEFGTWILGQVLGRNDPQFLTDLQNIVRKDRAAWLVATNRYDPNSPDALTPQQRTMIETAARKAGVQNPWSPVAMLDEHAAIDNRGLNAGGVSSRAQAVIEALTRKKQEILNATNP